MMTSLFSFFHRPIAGFFVLRWTVAGLMLLHGVSKLLHGLGPIEGMLVSAGLPSFIAYGVLVGEVVAPLFVLANRFVMPAALVMAFNMFVAVAMVHSTQVFTLGKSGGWALELQGLYFFGSLAIALMAPAPVPSSSPAGHD
jgi:putative oxidoreductase